MDDNCGRIIGALPFRIEKEICAVEEREVGLRPRIRVVELRRAVVERDPNLPGVSSMDAPGVGIELVPRQQHVTIGRRKARHVSREIVDLVFAGSPRGQREKNIPGPGRRKRHHDSNVAELGGGRVEGDVVLNVRDRRGNRYLRFPRLRERGAADKERGHGDRDCVRFHSRTLQGQEGRCYIRAAFHWMCGTTEANRCSTKIHSSFCTSCSTLRDLPDSNRRRRKSGASRRRNSPR